MSESSPILPGLSPVGDRPVEVRFDAGVMSSDAGLLVLHEVERKLGVVRRLANSLTDPRDPAKVQHRLPEMIGFRVLAIAAGYADGNDCDRLRTDPVFKMALDRLPVSGAALCSQPRISWLENLPNCKQLYRMAESQLDLYCSSYRIAPTAIVLDLDESFDAVHGSQELSAFNAYYRGHGFLPFHLFDQSGRLLLTVLRPANAPSGVEIRTLLKRVIGYLRQRWPRVRILVRGDAHYACPEVMDWCEAQHLAFLTGLAGNPVLERVVAERVARARKDWASRAPGKPPGWKLRRFMEFPYAAKSWSHPRRVVARIEVGRDGSDVRFIVTSRKGGTARWLYENEYCQRGQMENRIKDYKRYLACDRTSCCAATANQFRLFLHSAAYWLMWSLRAAMPRRSPWATAQFDTVRHGLIKGAGWVEERKTRIRVHLPRACPEQAMLRTLALRIPKLLL